MSFSCGLCGSNKTTFLFKAPDYSVSNEIFSVYSCEKCEVSISYPRLSKNQLLKYYDKKNYQPFKKVAFSLFDLVYNIMRFFNTKYKFNLIKPLIKGPVLDYGSGSGYFASFLRKKGVEIYNYEPINFSAGLKNASLSVRTLKKQKNYYSVVTLWHVLEHTNSPKKTLLSLRGLLKKEGFLVLALPNSNSYDSIYYGRFWAGYDLPRHRFHFNPLSFRVLCSSCGFRVLRVCPLFYDSYFVSILSEKNKNSFFPFIKGSYRGFFSNLKAKKTQNYSSLVYILKLK